MSGDQYEQFLSARHAHSARGLAEQARAGVPMTGDVLADVLENLAAIAERDAIAK